MKGIDAMRFAEDMLNRIMAADDLHIGAISNDGKLLPPHLDLVRGDKRGVVCAGLSRPSVALESSG